MNAARLENNRWTRALVRRIPLALRRRIFRGEARYCPVCRHSVSRFFHFGGANNPVWCPMCESVERMRLNWLYLERDTDLCDGRPKRLLHVAPEVNLAQLFQTLPNLERITMDLEVRPGVMLRSNLTELAFPDASFDLIYCSHVLEHVEDDARAMREMHRVLKPGGWAMLLVPPIRRDHTVEDPSITDRVGRHRRFGHPEHVRRYGRDYRDRLTAAGFRVTALSAKDLVGEENLVRYGVDNGDEVFRCDRD